MKSINTILRKLSFDDLHDWAGERILNRGKGYVKRVDELSCTQDNILVAWVSGSERDRARHWCMQGYKRTAIDAPSIASALQERLRTMAQKQRRHDLITSNHPFSAWDSVFPDNMMAVAAVDRLVHHADIIELTGESYRKRAQTTKKKER